MTPDNAQILFCDLQLPVVARSKTNARDAPAVSAGVLAKIARTLGLPMTFIVIPQGGKAPELIAELQPFASPQIFFRACRRVRSAITRPRKRCVRMIVGRS
jgi:hypothetical protein